MGNAAVQSLAVIDQDFFARFCAEWRQRVDQALAQHTAYGPDCPDRLREAIRHSLLAPAKRLRPLLVLLSCQACGGEPERALPAACAVEMVHTYSLIHDDLPAMDDDDLRRGRPSCHAQFGEATAILAGDALLAHAFELLATHVVPPELAAVCCGELAQAAGACNLVGGQQDDLMAQFATPDLAQLERIHRRKTGAMICVSVRLGGRIGGATQKQLAALTSYGQKVGLAFQIVDDLLDLEGQTEAMGKRVGKDAKKGKLTFPSLMGVEASRQRAGELVAAAEAVLSDGDLDSVGLVQLARFIVKRST
jgi:geranylgeranyl diphosphate synthase type II